MFEDYLGSVTAYAFFFQVFVLITPIIGSYFAYRQVRAPQKYAAARKALKELGLREESSAIKDALSQEYTIKDYFWPMIYATALTALSYSVTHPYALNNLGLWKGLLEQFINTFGVSEIDGISLDLFVGRFLLYGFIGAYMYTINMIFQRYLQYDLSPSVYIFASTRFFVAIFICAVVGEGLGVLNHAAGISFDLNLMTVSVVSFFIGFFPERGLDWIMAMSKRALNQSGTIANETRLSELEGLSIWHQGRLQQENIENVQNLATADIPSLIVNSPFSVAQIIDWIDQSILIVYANAVYRKIEDVGIRCASDFLVVGASEARMQQLAKASGVDIDRLWLLFLAVQNASNVQVTAYYRWTRSTNLALVESVKKLPPLNFTMTQAMPMIRINESSEDIALLPSTD
jgi:hypothetical protein